LRSLGTTSSSFALILARNVTNPTKATRFDFEEEGF
jgi:hypothetical protein